MNLSLFIRLVMETGAWADCGCALILGKLHPLFVHLSVENLIYANQRAYYDAITESSRITISGPSIDFINFVYSCFWQLVFHK